MRFRARVESPQPLIQLLNALSTMSSRCAITMTDSQWHFKICDKFVQSNHPQCYASIDILDGILRAYLIESKSDNNITFECDIKHLMRAFKSSINYTEGMVMIRMTKKEGNAILSFEMWGEDHAHPNQFLVNLKQEVPIILIPFFRQNEYCEPTIPQPEASVKLPDIKYLKGVCEKLVHLGNNGIISINNCGRLKITANQSFATMSTTFDNLALPGFNDNNNNVNNNNSSDNNNNNNNNSNNNGGSENNNRNENNNENKENENNKNNNKNKNKNNNNNEMDSVDTTAKFALKYFIKVLSSLSQLARDSNMICLSENHAITLHAVLAGDTSKITYYVCVYIDDQDMLQQENDDDSDIDVLNDVNPNDHENDNENDNDQHM